MGHIRFSASVIALISMAMLSSVHGGENMLDRHKILAIIQKSAMFKKSKRKVVFAGKQKRPNRTVPKSADDAGKRHHKTDRSIAAKRTKREMVVLYANAGKDMYASSEYIKYRFEHANGSKTHPKEYIVNYSGENTFFGQKKENHTLSKKTFASNIQISADRPRTGHKAKQDFSLFFE